MKNTIFDFISLHKGEESKEIVLRDVKDNISFKNANLWILVCAILIASIGLNVNSTAVIIGAMLISPLMGPIVGAGFAMATYDFELFKRALKNLLIATLVSLLVAFLYFLISPFKETQSEILARTSPNIYDVLIAFFGGIVGVISLTRVDKGNPIPGVAIATALMPPLCTAGYGLAVGNFTYFLGAFYLYTINCFFICIATFFITKYLKYPPVIHVDKKRDVKIHRIITALVVIMVLPSSYLAYDLYKEKQFILMAENFITKEFTGKGQIVIFKKIDYRKTPKIIELAILDNVYAEEDIQKYNQQLSFFDLENTKLVFRQGSQDNGREFLDEMNGKMKLLNDKNKEIEKLKNKIKSQQIDTEPLAKELAILFPEINQFSLGRHYSSESSDNNVLYFIYQVSQNVPHDAVKCTSWLKTKFENETVRVIRE
jgi:uncharacterized hydrophobic protein (TIGR00271 family)